MTTFHLTVVTPDGCVFDGQAERVVCRAIDGDLAILAKHGDYCTALGMGEAHIVNAEGQSHRAACMGGMLTVLDGEARLVATTWEWAEDIDQARAEASKKDVYKRQLLYWALASLSHVIFGWLPGVLSQLQLFQIGIPAFTGLYFDWFGGCIQAFIFCTLTAIFIKRAAGEE